MIALVLALALSTQPLHCRVSHGEVQVRLPATINPDIKFLAVVHGGEWHSIVDSQVRLATFPAPTVALPIKRQRAVEYRSGKPIRVAAFPRSGSYELVFSDNLETEPEAMASLSCRFVVRVP